MLLNKDGGVKKVDSDSCDGSNDNLKLWNVGRFYAHLRE